MQRVSDMNKWQHLAISDIRTQVINNTQILKIINNNFCINEQNNHQPTSSNLIVTDKVLFLFVKGQVSTSRNLFITNEVSMYQICFMKDQVSLQFLGRYRCHRSRVVLVVLALCSSEKKSASFYFPKFQDRTLLV